MSSKKLLLKQVLFFDAPKMDFWVALRSCVGVALALVGAMAWGPPGAGLYAALGALNVCFSDSSESYKKRARRMVLAAVVSSGFVLFASLAANVPAVALTILIVASFVAGLLVVLDNGSADIGTVAVATFVIFSMKGMPFGDALHYSFYALVGGLLQAGISIFLWPLRRYEPERKALAELYEQLADMALASEKPNEAPVVSAQASKAQDVLSFLARDLRTDARRYRSLLSQAERIRLSLISLKRLQARMIKENQAHEGAQLLTAMQSLAARTFIAVSKALRSRHLAGVGPTFATELDQLVKAMRQFDTTDESTFFKAVMQDAIYQSESLAGQMRAVMELTAKTTDAGELQSELIEGSRPLRLRFWGGLMTLRANLHLGSPGFRHAIRLAVSVAIGEAISHGLAVERSYWIPMTILIVLKPDYSATFSRGVLRVGGTFIGLGLATALYATLPNTPAVAIALTLVFTMMTRWVGAANYGIFAMGVAGLVVALVALLGVSPEAVIYARGVNTFIGGAVALTLFALWPTWERAQLSEVVARVLDSYRDYGHAVMRRIISGETAQLDKLRLAGRAARSGFQASMGRYLAERGSEAATREQLSSILASSNRLAHAIMSMEAGAGLPLENAEKKALEQYYEAVAKCLTLLSQALRGSSVAGKEFPNLRKAYGDFVAVEERAGRHFGLIAVEADRMTNSLNTLREEIMARLRSAK